MLLFRSLVIAMLLLSTHEHRTAHAAGPQTKFRTVRGEAHQADGVLAVTGTEASYREHRNHGPVTFVDVPFRDGTLEVAWKQQLEQGVTFLFDTQVDGARQHVLKLRFQAGELWLIAFEPEPKVTKHRFVTATGQWHELRVEFAGQQVRATVDGHEFELEHPALAQLKTASGVTHPYGTLETRGWKIAPAVEE